MQLGALFSIQYHNKEGLPSNFAVLGDASMKVNPVFGYVEPITGFGSSADF